jgi:hypothetical protein
MGIIGFDSLKNNTKQESLTDAADERSSEMPTQSLGKVDEQKTTLKDTNIQGLSLEPEAILENNREAKENKNRSFNRSLAKKQSKAVPQPAASIAANTISTNSKDFEALKGKQKVESGLRYFLKNQLKNLKVGAHGRRNYIYMSILRNSNLELMILVKLNSLKKVKLIMNNTAPTMILHSFLRFRHHSQLLQSMSILQVIPMSDAIWDGETSFLLKMLFVLRR